MIAARVLVTGTSGFVGSYLADNLAAAGYLVRAASRGSSRHADPRIEHVALPELAKPFRAETLVAGVDAIVHCAGLAHTSPDIPETLFTAINVHATRALALAARNAGARQFVLLSSVRAQAGPSAAAILTEAAPASPSDAYGRSKLAAEAALANELDGSATRWTALRPVLVYGPGVKANMASLVALARLPLPLPLERLKGRRSLLSIDNLCHGIRHMLEAPGAPNGAYLIADPEPVTVPQIIAALRRGLGRSPALFGVPDDVLMAGLRLARQGSMADRLLGDLVVDIAALRATGWHPPHATTVALAAMMQRSR